MGYKPQGKLEKYSIADIKYDNLWGEEESRGTSVCFDVRRLEK